MHKTQDNYIEKFTLSRKAGEIKLVKEDIDINEALYFTLLRGLGLICDQERYSNDRFRRYTKKWGF